MKELQKIAQIDGDVIRYQLSDHLGSASLELDENADIISYEEYYPFGTSSYRSGRSQTEVSQKRYKYVMKELDNETGLYYYGMRYYAAWLCRFVSVDPLQHKNNFEAPYVYVNNRPIVMFDPDGKDGRLIVEKYEDGGGVITVQSTIFVFGNLSTQELVDQYNNDWNALNTSYEINDENGEDWTINIDLNFVYLPRDMLTDVGIHRDAQSIEEFDNFDKNKIGFQDGDNVLVVHSNLNFFSDISTPGQAFQNYAKTFNPKTGLHESFHLIGFSDRYIEGQMDTTGFEEGDIMSRRNYDNISPIHFINIFEVYKNEKEGRGDFVNFDSGIVEYIFHDGVGYFDYNEADMTPDERLERINEKIKYYK